MDDKTKLKIVLWITALLMVSFIVGGFFATRDDSNTSESEFPGATDADAGHHNTSDFKAWCTDASVQRKVPTDEKFAVTGDCRRTEAEDGGWSLNCNLTPTTSKPVIRPISDPTGQRSNGTCKSTPNRADTYKLSFIADKSFEHPKSTLTHYKWSDDDKSEVLVNWAKTTEMHINASDKNETHFTDQTNKSISIVQNESNENETRISKTRTWDRSKCLPLLPECVK